VSNNSRRRPVAQRFWSKVTGGDYTTCWQWTGAANPRTGYGTFGVEKGKFALPHRWAYEALCAEIPAGLQIDHLCRNRLCVNPWHLEPVTPRENVRRCDSPFGRNARRTHCIHGHELSPENTQRTTTGGRSCKTCNARRESESRARKAARLAQSGGAR
jgi:hypothetical protein